MATEAAPALTLPKLRQELQLSPGPSLNNGAPSWTLFDPLRHLFFQLGQIEFRILSLWSRGDIASMQKVLRAEGLSDADSETALRNVVEFSLANSLTVTPAQEAVESFTRQHEATQKSWWRWLIDNYLFIRVPLFRPSKFLARTLPYVQFIWSPAFVFIIALIGLTGLFLASRQWDHFLLSLSYLFSAEGLLAYGLALGLVKVAHEFGHGYMATRFGCRVPTMGVSFLVLMPVLYTDTTQAWRLTSRRQRLLIDCAGVSVELMIASVATFLWAIMDDGPVRDALHVLATTSWITSLIINISPFMRFDGYYILSDATEMPNLQPRAFAMGRWRIREMLFALGDPPPEQMTKSRERWVTLYAWATWLYRFFLFLGIALLVYHFFFKALGILLFVVELVMFIGRPVYREVAQWAQMKDRIMASKRARIWPWVGGAALLFVILPLDRHISAPAILTPIGDTPIVAGTPAVIEQILVKSGQTVTAGTPLFVLRDPAIERDIAAANVRLARAEAQFARAGGSSEELAQRTVFERQVATERNSLKGLTERTEKLTLRASTDGQIVDIPPALHAGLWVSGTETLGRMISPGRYDIQAYVGEQDIWRLYPEASARFIPDDITQGSRRARASEVAKGGLEALDAPILASTNGGPISVSKDANGLLKPQRALYRVRLIAELDDSNGANAATQIVPGSVTIRAKAESILNRAARGLGRIVAKEHSVSS